MTSEILAAWLAARSIARGLPLPVRARGALRVDTGSPAETRRYVFAGPAPEISALAASITAPRIFIKMCGEAERLLELVPPRWELEPGGYLMTRRGAREVMPTPPAGYRLALTTESATVAARMFDAGGALAASGYAVEHGGVFIFDRIVTAPQHRRRGLGRAIMAALGSTQRSLAPRVLVATEPGRALYEALGWATASPYSTVVIKSGYQ